MMVIRCTPRYFNDKLRLGDDNAFTIVTGIERELGATPTDCVDDMPQCAIRGRFRDGDGIESRWRLVVPEALHQAYERDELDGAGWPEALRSCRIVYRVVGQLVELRRLQRPEQSTQSLATALDPHWRARRPAEPDPAP